MPAMDDCWILGVDKLGDYYPAQVRSAAETFDLSGVDSDLWVSIDGGVAIASVDVVENAFRFTGSESALFPAGGTFVIVDSTGPDFVYTVTLAGSTESGGLTLVPVNEGIVNPDGRAVQRVVFSHWAGTDFVDPAAATADEVAVLIADRLIGADTLATNPGTGTVVVVASASPSGEIQVRGGTANAVLGFDTGRVSATGGCRLGPSDERGVRTFDVEVLGVLPSSQVVTQIERIARYAKPVNTHLGRVRERRVVSEVGGWILGTSRLGIDTDLE